MDKDALRQALAKAGGYNRQLDERLLQTGIVDGGLFLDFASVQDDPNASSHGWLCAKLEVLSARLATGAALSLHDPATGSARIVTSRAELAEWAGLHFPIAGFRP